MKFNLKTADFGGFSFEKVLTKNVEVSIIVYNNTRSDKFVRTFEQDKFA